jgi:hypothetical protein
MVASVSSVLHVWNSCRMRSSQSCASLACSADSSPHNRPPRVRTSLRGRVGSSEIGAYQPMMRGPRLGKRTNHPKILQQGSRIARHPYGIAFRTRTRSHTRAIYFSQSWRAPPPNGW